MTARPPKETPPHTPPKDLDDREAKLAQALRANLRRRKKGALPPAPKDRPGDST